MRLRHETFMPSIDLDGEPNTTFGIDIPGAKNLETTLVVLSRLNPETDEDLPCLLIRIDQEIDGAAFTGEHAETLLDRNYLPRVYSESSPIVEASHYIKRPIFGSKSLDDVTKTLEPNFDLIGLEQAMSETATRLTNVLRWRQGIITDQRLQDDRTLLLERPDGNWSLLWNSRPGLILRVAIVPELSTESAGELQSMISQQKSEPLSRDILREAFDLADSNSRASLILAVSAAEVGTKQFMLRLLPDYVENMVVELPQTSLVKIMSNILPPMITHKLGVQSYAFPKNLKNNLGKLVEHRNALVHQPPTTAKAIDAVQFAKSDSFRDHLRTVSNYLYLLDYFSGEEWAAEKLPVELKPQFAGGTD